MASNDTSAAVSVGEQLGHAGFQIAALAAILFRLPIRSAAGKPRF